MRGYLTLGQTISLLLRERGVTGMENPRTIVAYAMDYLDSTSPELRVIEQCLLAGNLRLGSRERRKIEQSIAEGFVDPFARAARRNDSVDDAVSLAFSYLKDECMVRESVARQVVDEIAWGITRWHAMVDEEFSRIDRVLSGMLLDSLDAGTVLRTTFGRELRVVRQVGERGWGTVYEVDCEGKRMTLEWYQPDALLHDRARFMDSLRSCIVHGSPSPDFLWPMDITEDVGGAFGCLMDQAVWKYTAMSDLLTDPDASRFRHRSWRPVIDACLGIVMAMSALHDVGYCYRDFTEGSVLVNPSTGEVLIRGVGDVVPRDTSAGITGTVGYMAPEVMLAENPVATIESDLFSMAVLVFNILVGHHPLRGGQFGKMCHDEKSLRYLYGTHPRFAFDKYGRGILPVRDADGYARSRWFDLPVHMFRLFCRAFSHEALHCPAKRPSEIEWVRHLARLRSEFKRCVCGNEVLLIQDSFSVYCPRDGAYITTRLCLVLPVGEAPENRVPVVDGACVYRCQVQNACDRGTELEPQLCVRRSMSGENRWRRELILRNVSHEPWVAYAEGQRTRVDPGQNMRVIDGLELAILGKVVRVCDIRFLRSLGADVAGA